MLDIAFIRQNPDVVRAAITNKRLDLDLDALLAADTSRRELLTKLEAARTKKNTVAASIPKASKEDRPKLIEEGREVKAEIEKLEPEVAALVAKFDDLMLRVPSIPRPEVPIGKGEEDNVEILDRSIPPGRRSVSRKGI